VTEETDVLAKLLFDLERQLMDPVVRRDRVRVSALLHEEFREFGSSGRAWSREAILDSLEQESGREFPEVIDFTLRLVSTNAALVTYRAVYASKTSLRSSLWVNDGEAWRMIFHQGTKVP
jgi:ribonuclease HI